MNLLWRLAAGIVVLLAAMVASAQNPVPYLSGRIVDQAGILSAPASDRLSAMLKAHEDARGNQIAVLTVSTLGGESVEDYAVRVFEDWKLGKGGQDNGVLVVVVPEDRRMRIEVGYGLEGVLTDAAASRIIRDLMTPRFREGNYDVGVEAGITAVIQILEGRQSTDPQADWAAEPQAAKAFHVEAPDMSIAERILVGLFVFSIIGIFTFIGLVTPGGVGWFLYVFLIPFWSMFPMALFGSGPALWIIAAYAVLYPAAKLFIRRMPWYLKAQEDLKRKGVASIGGVTIGGSSSGRSGGFSSGGGFSGGGGRSGGGGASGSW